MTYKQIGNIKLQYDETVVDIERIANIIKLNQYLFADYSGKIIFLGTPILSDCDNIIYIPDFDEFFDYLLKTLLKDNTISSYFNNPNLLPALYIQVLLKNTIQSGDSLVLFDNNISDDMLWFLIACQYFNYKTNFREFSDFLKYRNDSERILDWLKESQRFKTYNYLLEVSSNYLKENDLSFFDNIGEIISKMAEENMELTTASPTSNYNLPKMSFDLFEKIFFGFLKSIKAPEEWKILYIKLKREKKIIFEESSDGLDHSEVFIDTDGIRKIKITTDGTIKFFISFVHEFIHYVSLQSGIPPFSLLELPSIYYERMAACYLISMGYDENIMKQVIQNRKQNNLDIYCSIFDLLLDICRYNNKGPITREAKIEFAKKLMEPIYETRKNLAIMWENVGEPIEDSDFLTMPNYEELVDEECDENISKFIKSGLLIINGYQYLTDSYLVDSILENQNDDTTFDKMVLVTEHLANFNLEKIMTYFGISSVFKPSTRNMK